MDGQSIGMVVISIEIPESSKSVDERVGLAWRKLEEYKAVYSSSPGYYVSHDVRREIGGD